MAMRVLTVSNDDEVLNHLAVELCIPQLFSGNEGRECVSAGMCSYLMSSSRSHSVWFLKCNLVIWSVCVFLSSCVTLTWRKQKDTSSIQLVIFFIPMPTCYVFSGSQSPYHHRTEQQIIYPWLFMENVKDTRLNVIWDLGSELKHCH